MANRRKFSIFISSTYKDLIDERQALLEVALENNFIPVGMEQFHAVPTSQWSVITKMIDECDFYLLVIGGRYGSIDETTNLSYTEKEYNYAKEKGLPVLVLIKDSSVITESKKDTGNEKYEKMEKLDGFREKVKNDGNTVGFFTDVNDLKYVASASLKNAINYSNGTAGWVRYKDVLDLISEKTKSRNKSNEEQQQKVSEKEILSQIISRLTDLEDNQLTWEEFPKVTKDTVVDIPVEPAFLLVYAADSNGQIIKTQTLGLPVQIFTSGKRFMADDSKRESARWVEALDQLLKWGWVKAVGYKGEIFELTGTGYNKADLLKDDMKIDTSKDPLDELKKFEA